MPPAVLPPLDPAAPDQAGYRLLQHTADIGILAWGPHREDVLLHSARGLLEILFGRDPGSPAARQRQQVRLEFATPEELLVDWLNELLFLVAVQGFVPAAITIEKFGDRQLEASLLGERRGGGAAVLDTEVKAATYHQVAFRKRKGRWEGRIYLDL